jgi:hypothetical protein
MRRSLTTYLNSPLMTQLSLELTLTRVTITAMSQAAEQRERVVSHWKAEARWWREEHDRVSSEYTTFVREMARRVRK